MGLRVCCYNVCRVADVDYLDTVIILRYNYCVRTGANRKRVNTYSTIKLSKSIYTISLCVCCYNVCRVADVDYLDTVIIMTYNYCIRTGINRKRGNIYCSSKFSKLITVNRCVYYSNVGWVYGKRLRR